MLSRGLNIAGYLVDRRISDGPMCSVYRVQHRALGSDHALKLLSENYGSVMAIQHAFVKDMTILSELRSPYFVRVTDVVQSSLGVGIVMDWVEGETLADHVKRLGGLDARSAVTWTAQLLSALAELHATGLFHGEVSSHNVFLERNREGQLQAVLMDFGLSQRLGGKVQAVPNPKALAYLSPEQLTNPEQIGQLSDLYSVGVVLQEVLTGQAVFEGETDYACMNAIVEGRRMALSIQDHQAPAGLTQFLSRAMRVDPAARFGSALEMLSELQHICSEPLLALPQPSDSPDNSSAEFQEVIDTEIIDVGGGTRSKQRDSSPEPPIVVTGVSVSAKQSASPSPAVPWKGVGKLPSWGVPKRIQHTLSLLWPKSSKAWLGIAAIFLAAGVLLLGQMGGFGRTVELQFILPDWGRTLIFLDGEPLKRGRRLDVELSPGWHQLQLSGGFWYDGECDHCCWGHDFPFEIELGFGAHTHRTDATNIPGQFSCPTAETKYLMLEISEGRFWLGTPPNVPVTDGESQHSVQISAPFVIARTEVTQELYTKVMGHNPSENQSPLLPVDSVSWFDAIEFCNRLSLKEGLEPCYEVNGSKVLWSDATQCQGYRLPTEAEWDYAARGGLPIQVNGTFRLYAGSSRYGLMGWSEENAMGRPHEVGEKYPNNWGLVDVSGNVAEWVWDWYGPYGTRSMDPVGPDQGHSRVLRGGSWQDSVVDVQTTRRNSAAPQHRHETIGFRVARTLGVLNSLPAPDSEEK